MEVFYPPLQGLVLLTPRRFEDVRGHFCEVWNRRVMAELGLDLDFVQDNQSLSRDAGTVRGLHYQAPPFAQDKLVRCGRGALYDVAVDARRGSPSYGRWYGVELSAENGRQLLVPKGFLHGFVSLESDTEILYKCTDYYSATADGAVRFDDPALAIDWGIDPAAAILSDKDRAAPGFAEFDSPFAWEAAT